MEETGVDNSAGTSDKHVGASVQNMCTIVMPADYDMLVSHSPPVFSHSPPTSFINTHYEPFSTIARNCRPFPLTTRQTNIRMPSYPRRPCLVIRADDAHSSGDEDPQSPTKLKKKVVFADDKGMSLTHVRVMTEPSNVPPLWSFRFLAQVTHGVTAEPVAEQEPWEILFPQPASDYLEFRKQLDHNKVSLENVIVKEGEDLILGTIKVSNLSFHKEVILRVSTDSWKTHEDVQCSFVANSVTCSAYVLYDTFSFKMPLPPKSRSIEFCVCFRCDGEDYWDNNSGNNYQLVKKLQHSIHKSRSYEDLTSNNNNTNVMLTMKCADVFQAKVESWSEFASWTHLENNNPYW